MNEQRTEHQLRQHFSQLENCVSCYVEDRYKVCPIYAPDKSEQCAWYNVILHDLKKRDTNQPSKNIRYCYE